MSIGHICSQNRSDPNGANPIGHIIRRCHSPLVKLFGQIQDQIRRYSIICHAFKHLIHCNTSQRKSTGGKKLHAFEVQVGHMDICGHWRFEMVYDMWMRYILELFTLIFPEVFDVLLLKLSTKGWFLPCHF